MESEEEHGQQLLHGEEIASVAAGSEHWLALTAGGLLYGGGSNSHGQQ
jgi:alpha-tubulin suppressor-like RCC1 family protein